MTRRIVLFLSLIVLAACGDSPVPDDSPTDLSKLVRDYLFLELSMGKHDEGHVDAYFGPEEIKLAADESALSLDEIRAQSAQLAGQLSSIDTRSDETLTRRIAGLLARLQALDTRIAINKGELPRFDDESMLLFGTTAPSNDASHFDAILQEIDKLLPGPGPLGARVEEFNDAFAIPTEKLAAVFDAAIGECRRRTLAHIDLPEGETFSIEYVVDKPWSGYNWYQGDAVSLIQINTEFPIYIRRAVDLGCHEGYPGHHTFNALLEQNLVNNQNWLEFSLYPLFSPQSLIAEGTGNYGIELAFPGDERIEFEKEVLFPLAGLDAGQADRYYQLAELLASLNYAGNEAARGFLNGELSRDQAVQWLTTYALSTEEKARQRTRFFDAYRSYVINYNHGMDMVATHIERDGADAAERWSRFESMLSSPVLPSDLE